MTGDSVRDLVDSVMGAVLSGDHPHLRTLRTQYDHAGVTINTTGVGFFAEFEVPATVDPIPVTDRVHVGDVEASMRELDHGMGFVLFVDDGTITTLEGYTYDEAMPEHVTGVDVWDRSDDPVEDRLFPD